MNRARIALNSDHGFISHLTPEALKTLRRIVRRTYMRYHAKHLQTDYEADRIIESLGPKVAESLIMQGKDSGLIERKTIISR